MSSIEGLKILIAEDDSSLLRIMSATLKRKGAVVHEALDGDKALAILSNTKIDLILSDVQMPHKSGIELLSEVRRTNPELPVVLFVTGEAQLDEKRSIELGASGLMSKPVRAADLIARITALMGHSMAS